MRNILAYIICCCILIPSCRKKKSDTNVLVGNWAIDEYQHEGQPWRTPTPNERDTFIFKSNDAFIYTPGPRLPSIPCTGKFTIIKDSLLLNWNCPSGMYATTAFYSVSNDILTFRYPPYPPGVGYQVRYRRF